LKYVGWLNIDSPICWELDKWFVCSIELMIDEYCGKIVGFRVSFSSIYCNKN
jgi:hypothetical protein